MGFIISTKGILWTHLYFYFFNCQLGLIYEKTMGKYDKNLHTYTIYNKWGNIQQIIILLNNTTRLVHQFKREE